MPQLVKEPLFSIGESRGSDVIYAENSCKVRKYGAFPALYCQFFQIHGSIFKPDPTGNSGQATVMCVTHGVFSFASANTCSMVSFRIA